MVGRGSYYILHSVEDIGMNYKNNAIKYFFSFYLIFILKKYYICQLVRKLAQ